MTIDSRYFHGPESSMYALAHLCVFGVPFSPDDRELHNDTVWAMWVAWVPHELVAPDCPVCFGDWTASRPYCPHCDFTDESWPPELRERLLGRYLARAACAFVNAFAEPAPTGIGLPVLSEPLRSTLTPYQLELIRKSYRAELARLGHP